MIHTVLFSLEFCPELKRVSDKKGGGYDVSSRANDL